jgi:hypothetical protein
VTDGRARSAELQARAHLIAEAISPDAAGAADGHLTPHPEVGRRGFRIARLICPRAEFNAHRARLPRSVRRDVEVVPVGHVGLIVQAVAGGDSPLLAVYGHVRADRDPADALAALERRLRTQLS